MPRADIIYLHEDDVLSLDQISFLSGYYRSSDDEPKYPFAPILYEEKLLGNITDVYECVFPRKVSGITPFERTRFTIDFNNPIIILTPYCPYFLKQELLTIINDKIKPYIKKFYSLETETQADVGNLKDAYIAELETENEHLKVQLEEIQINESAAQQEGGTPNLTPAQRAAQAKSEKSLAAWKEVFPAMMKVYARCMEEGEKPRQGPDFYAMFNELNVELTDTQFKYFCSCLPKGYKDTEGGKPGKV